MRLYITYPSPYARKCRIVAREKGLQNRVEEIAADPYASDPALVAANPIAQVPALVTDEGEVFTDSPLICAYLDSLGTGARLIPAEGADHWRVRRAETAADAVLEMGVKMVLELRRPEHERSPSWLERWKTGLFRQLDAIEAQGPRPEPLDMGVITTGVALSWLDFRHPTLDWKTGRPNLAALQQALEARESFRDTYPRV
jgi:glutathione S-transferase